MGEQPTANAVSPERLAEMLLLAECDVTITENQKTSRHQRQYALDVRSALRELESLRELHRKLKIRLEAEYFREAMERLLPP